MQQQQQSGGGFPRGLLIGCLVLLGVVVVGVFGIGAWLVSGPESGVKLGNEMDQYAIDYLAKHKILNPGEEVLAYYDVTISMDGTEAAILTRDRVIYHKAGRSTAVRLQDVRDIRHRYESLIGDVLEIEDQSGKILKIEIAPLNQGETFKNALMSAWNSVRGATTTTS